MRSAVLGKKQEKSFPHLNVYQSVKNFSRWSGTQAKYSQVFKKKKIIEFCSIVHENPQDYSAIKRLPPWLAPHGASMLLGEAGQDVPVLPCFSLAERRHAVMQ